MDCLPLFSHHGLSPRPLSLGSLFIHVALTFPVLTAFSHSVFPTSSLQLVCSIGGCTLRKLFYLKSPPSPTCHLGSLSFAGSICHIFCMIGPLYFLFNATLTIILKGRDWLPRIMSPLGMLTHGNEKLFFVEFCHFSLNKILWHPKLLGLLKGSICFWGYGSWPKSLHLIPCGLQDSNVTSHVPIRSPPCPPFPFRGHLVQSQDFLGTKNSSIWRCYMWLL